MNYTLDAMVSPACYAMLVTDYPGIRKNKGHARLLGYLFFTGSLNRQPPKAPPAGLGIAMPYRVVQACYGVPAATKTEGLLKTFFTDVHAFVTTPHDRRRHTPRVIYVPDTVKYRDANQLSGEKVSIVTGKPIPAPAFNTAMKTAIREANATLPDASPLKLAQTMLHEVRATYFRIEAKDHQAAVALIQETYEGDERQRWLAAVGRLYGQPARKPIYSKAANSPRLYARHPVLYMPAPLRRAMLPGWVEMDLQSAHLAIASKVLGLPELHAFLKAGHNPWDELQKASGLSRKQLKDVINPLLNGAGIDEMVDNSGVSEDLVKGLLKHRLLKSLRGKRNQFAAAIAKAGGVTLPSSGKWLTLHPKTKPLSLLAQVLQDYETQLIAPVFDYANEMPDQLKVIYFQHDGFTFHLRARHMTPMIHQCLKAHVDLECKRLDIPTRLVLTSESKAA